MEPQRPARRALGESAGGGRVAEAQNASEHASVPATVGEGDAVVLHQRREVLTPRLPAPAPDLEDVGEVGAELELDPVVERRAQVAGEREPLDQSVAQRQLPPDVDDVARVPGVAAERQVVHREVDERAVRARRLGRQQHGRAPGDAKPVAAQDPGVVLEEAKRAAAGGRDVAVLGHQEEQPIVLEDDGVLGERLVGAGDRGVADRLFHRDRPQLLRR